MTAETEHAPPLMVDVINRHQKTWPVNVEGIAHDLGIAVRYDRSLSNNVSGKIVADRARSRGSGYLIVVNANHHENRRRFTLAHEIAHYMLHRDHIGDGIEDDGMYRSAHTTDNMERQANLQAAIMLMPAPLVLQAYRGASRSPHVLASLFKVSESAMRIRLEELRLGH